MAEKMPNLKWVQLFSGLFYLPWLNVTSGSW
jgi:hypothetical protein